ncbi:iron transporter [Patulibacter americanus]|uniref:iron transporter n=1 Tax=Patulibacter americanus TaxID=588672 RepID=UPI0003B3D1F0|nr:iron transporter [Patulibacter americanus]
MTPRTRTSSGSRATALAAAATLALAGVLAGCGGGEDDARVSASGTTATAHGDGHADHGATGEPAAAAPSKADQQAHAATMQMRRLGSATAGDRKIELDASDATTFTVPEGGRFVTHRPRKGENAHLMLMLSDVETGERLPDATITLRVVDAAGKVVSSGPQYPMFGMGMGMHYGDNVTIPKAGRYVAQLVVGPPMIGRHGDVAQRWTTTVRAEIPFTWEDAAR